MFAHDIQEINNGTGSIDSIPYNWRGFSTNNNRIKTDGVFGAVLGVDAINSA